MKPRTLIVTTLRWISTAQLAAAFCEAGWEIELLCPSGHPSALVPAVVAVHTYRALRPLASVRAGLLAASAPELIVAGDDLAAALLQQIQCELAATNSAAPQPVTSASAASGSLLAALRRSLAPVESFALLNSRASFSSLAAQHGIVVPASANLLDMSTGELGRDTLGTAQYPLVIKADGTSGGEGVSIVRDAAEAQTACRILRRPLRTRTVLLKAAVDQNMNVLLPWILRRPRTLSMQSYIDGPDANIALACWQGKVLAAIAVEVLHTRRDRGPSAVIRVIDNAAMLDAAKRMVELLGLSGLCGFDFVIDRHTGTPFLIEINARATPTCHLALGPGRDLVAALAEAATGTPHRARPLLTENSVLALFPVAWQIDPASEHLAHAYRDLPADPALAAAGLAPRRGPTRAQWQRWKARAARLAFFRHAVSRRAAR